jgi:hypothetical protein
MVFRLQMRQLNERERTYLQLLLDAPDPFETNRTIARAYDEIARLQEDLFELQDQLSSRQLLDESTVCLPK